MIIWDKLKVYNSNNYTPDASAAVSVNGGLEVKGGITGTSINLGTGTITGGAFSGGSVSVTGTISGSTITGSSLNVSNGSISGGSISGSSLNLGSGSITCGVINGTTLNVSNISAATLNSATLNSPTLTGTVTMPTQITLANGEQYNFATDALQAQIVIDAHNTDSTHWTWIRILGLPVSTEFYAIQITDGTDEQSHWSTVKNHCKPFEQYKWDGYGARSGYKILITSDEGADPISITIPADPGADDNVLYFDIPFTSTNNATVIIPTYTLDDYASWTAHKELATPAIACLAQRYIRAYLSIDSATSMLSATRFILGSYAKQHNYTRIGYYNASTAAYSYYDYNANQTLSAGMYDIVFIERTEIN